VGVGLIIDIPAIAKALGMDEGTKDWLYYAGLIINGITMCASIVAFQIAIREYKENWIIWICSNVAVLILWSISIAENIELHENAKVFTSAFTLFTYSFSFVNSIYGYLNWSKK
jgi:nicotinamide mononucleotide transporter PnuC